MRDRAAQFNNLSIVLHLATTENIATALLYDSLLPAHLEELASARAERSEDVVDFDELLSVGQPRFNLQAVAQAAKAAPSVDPKKDKLPNDTPSVPKTGWLPKKEYLAKLEAGRATKAAADAAVRRQPSSNRSRSRRARSRSNRLDPPRQRRASPKLEPMRTRRQRR